MARRPGVSVRLEGDKELERRLKRLGPAFNDAIDSRIQASGIRVQRAAVGSIQRGPASGATYDSIFRMIGGRPVPIGPRSGNNLSPTHTASAPGQPPMSDTGTLANSVTYVSDNLSARVGTRLDYGRHLEFGTTAMAARPWLFPALEGDRNQFLRELRGIVDEAERKSRGA